MGDQIRSTTDRPGLCVTVGAQSMAELRRARDHAAVRADLVEVRLDAADAPDVDAALEGRRGPVLITCRPGWEGGGFRGSEEERERLLVRAWELGAEFVDVETRAAFAPAFLARTGGARVVLSMHDYDGVPADLEARAKTMAATTAAVVKIAVRAARLADMAPVFGLARTLSGRRFVGIAMGMAGIATRILAARVGCAWTYAGDGWAPGQVPADVLLDGYRFRSITAATSVYGVVGRPIGHSLSPAMHNAAWAATGEDAVYLPFEAESADDFLACAALLGIRGASVTAPFKVALVPRASLDAVATRVGALNTLRRDGAGWSATNTDPAGFLAPLAGRIALEGCRCAVLGTGGAARAVALALAGSGALVTIHGRDNDRAAAVAALAGGRASGFTPEDGGWDVLVNATPIGTAPRSDESPLPAGPFTGRLVYDLVYNPPQTRLLSDAAAAGCDVLGGLDMLVAQAQAQRTFWTGRPAEAGVLRAAALRQLEPHRTTVRAGGSALDHAR